ncbi:MAG: EAL domain-containing protein [Candidatus Omnitrophota bacterium]
MDKKKLILIIDDEPDFIKTMQFYLERSGFKIITAYDGKTGIEKAGSKPDLVILDLKMPGMSGHEVSRRLKEDKFTQNIPIIMLTSQDETIDKVEALDMGVTDYVGKSFPMEEILARIKAALRGDVPHLGPSVARERDKKLFDLKYAIANSTLRVFYQQIADLDSRSTIGYEATVSGPQGTPIEERETLLNAALEGGLTLDLERLYHSLALRKARHFRQGNILFLRTETSMLDTEYYKSLEFLKETPVEASHICLEITERDSAKNMPKMIGALRDVKSKGIKLAVCDVNADYQGMKAIENIRPDYIKIDAALIRCIDIDEVKKSLVQAIFNLSKNIGATLIAEGIEADYECGALISLGVKCGQGPLFGRPSEDI